VHALMMVRRASYRVVPTSVCVLTLYVPAGVAVRADSSSNLALGATPVLTLPPRLDQPEGSSSSTTVWWRGHTTTSHQRGGILCPIVCRRVFKSCTWARVEQGLYTRGPLPPNTRICLQPRCGF
jgi:hypothetical protein